MNATQLLKKDHAAVKKLFHQFGRTGERAVKTRQRLIDRLATELDVHAKIEEQIFYPAVARVESLRHLVTESKKEHDEVKRLVAEIQGMSADADDLDEKVQELRDAVLHHASEEEEGKMFPRVHRAFSADELDRLGAELRKRKQALLHGAMGRITRAVKKGLRKAA
jgi:hemerythrin superfamily protein